MRSLTKPADYRSIHTANRLAIAPPSWSDPFAIEAERQLDATYGMESTDVGLVIIPDIPISNGSQARTNGVGINAFGQLDAWRGITDTVHANGGTVVIQLMHAGRVACPDETTGFHKLSGPSAIAASGEVATPKGAISFPVPVELDAAGIARVVIGFQDAADRAMSAGFDGVEINAGDGFLLHQFMAVNSNFRADQYGGTIANRTRLTLEIVESVASCVGEDRVALHLSPGSFKNDIVEGDTGALYSKLVFDLPDLAYLHISETGNREQTREIRRGAKSSIILQPWASDVDPSDGLADLRLILAENIADGIDVTALRDIDPNLIGKILGRD